MNSATALKPIRRATAGDVTADLQRAEPRCADNGKLAGEDAIASVRGGGTSSGASWRAATCC